MGRQHLVDVHVADASERVEKVGQRIVGLLDVNGDAGADPRQHVVAAEEQPPFAIVKADVPGRVSRGVQCDQVPARQRDRSAILEQHVGLGRGDELADAHRGAGQLVAHVLGDAGVDQQCAHVGKQGGNVDAVSRRDQRRIRRVQRNPCTGGLAQPAGQPVVVGMDVRDEHRLDIRRRVPGDAHARDERVPRLLGAPSRVDHRKAAVKLEQVDEDVPKWVLGQRHRHRPQPRPHTLDIGEPGGIPGAPLRGSR